MKELNIIKETSKGAHNILLELAKHPELESIKVSSEQDKKLLKRIQAYEEKLKCY